MYTPNWGGQQYLNIYCREMGAGISVTRAGAQAGRCDHVGRSSAEPVWYTIINCGCLRMPADASGQGRVEGRSMGRMRA